MRLLHLLVHALVRWLDFLALTTLLGGLVFRHLVVRTAPTSPHLFRRFDDNLRRVLGAAILVLAVSSVADLILRARAMAGGGLADLGTLLPLVLRQTHYGTVWIARMSAIALLGAGWVLAVPGRTPTARSIGASFLWGLVIALTTTLSGHAADWGDLTLPVLVDWLHLLATSTWIGGLFTLGFVLHAAVQSAGTGETPHGLASAASRFSRIAGWSVAFFIATGLYNAWLHVASPSPLLTTPYGWTLTAKLSLLLLALLLASLNRYYLLPLLGDHPAKPARRLLSALGRLADARRIGRGRWGEEKIRARFFGAVRLEWVVAVGMLACSALLTQLPPARHIRRHEHREQHAAHRPALVESAARPAGSDRETFSLTSSAGPGSVSSSPRLER